MTARKGYRVLFRKAVPTPIHEVLEALGVLAHDLGQKAYLVGGMVRDIALRRENVDLDIAVEGDGQHLARVFARRTGGIVKGVTRFGTCKVESRAFGIIDVATTRSELYRRPGALPEVGQAGIEQDLARRDFTINAMAVGLGPGDYGNLVDPFGGLDDIARRNLTILHARSFEDDPTRILRGVRFAARYGFTFERKTLRLLERCVAGGGLGSVSGARIFTELELICREGRAARAIGLLRKYSINGHLSDSMRLGACEARYIKKLGWARERVEAIAREAPEERSYGRGRRETSPGSWSIGSGQPHSDQADWHAAVGKGRGEASRGVFSRGWLVWFTVFFVDVGKARAGRLAGYFNLPKEVREVCVWVAGKVRGTHARLVHLDGESAYRVVRLLRDVPPEGIVHLFAISGRRERNLIALYLKRWCHVSPKLSGRELVSLGVPEGPLVGRTLEGILRLKLRGRLATREDEMAYVRRHVSKPGARRDHGSIS